MVAKVQRTEQGLAILLSPEMLDILALQEGAEVEIVPVQTSAVKYAADADVLRSFEKTLPRHDGAYRALAK